jgi:LEA14-like dessication related protein
MKRSAILIFLAILLTLSSCMSWFLKQPTFALKEVSITRFSSSEIHLLFGIEVQNPNSFELNLLSLEYTVSFNDREVGKGRVDKEVKIAKASSTLVQIPLQTDLKNLGDPLRLVFGGQNLRYKIEGTAVIKASVGTATYPFSKSDEIKIKK